MIPNFQLTLSLSLALVNNEATEHRTQREQHLLSLYHNTLLSAGVPNFSYDDCILAYRKVCLSLFSSIA